MQSRQEKIIPLFDYIRIFILKCYTPAMCNCKKPGINMAIHSSSLFVHHEIDISISPLHLRQTVVGKSGSPQHSIHYWLGADVKEVLITFLRVKSFRNLTFGFLLPCAGREI